MIERIRDRCARLCGSEDAECFAKNPRQLSCIADLVVNRSGSIAMLLRRKIERPDASEDLTRSAFRDTNELTNYFQYLMLAKDLRSMHELVLDADLNEKRAELRFPIPCEFDSIVSVRASGQDAGLINYSQSGVRILTASALEAGSRHAFEIGRPDDPGSWVGFMAEVRNATQGHSGKFAAGMRVLEVDGRSAFNFFSTVHSMFSGPETF